MSLTFATFLIIGPSLRPITLLILLNAPMTPTRRRSLARISRQISVFYALEVMILAIPLINIAFGPMSNQLRASEPIVPRDCRLVRRLSSRRAVQKTARPPTHRSLRSRPQWRPSTSRHARSSSSATIQGLSAYKSTSTLASATGLTLPRSSCTCSRAVTARQRTASCTDISIR